MTNITGYKLIWNTETDLTTGINVRFFIYDSEADDGEGDIVETNLWGFEEAEGEITLERHSVRENGSNQICFTKMPKG